MPLPNPSPLVDCPPSEAFGNLRKPASNPKARFQISGFLLCLLSLLCPLYADPLTEGNAKIKVHPIIPLKVYAFPLQEVKLLAGPFKHAMELDQQYLLSLDVNRLLHNFRVNAGLPSAAQPLGGWEAPDCELRGHFVGHYLSACALMYASTGDKRFKEKGNDVVSGLVECQNKLGSGYLSAYPESFIDRVEKPSRVWAPYYTLHKIFVGLEDMYEYCDNQQALEMAKKFGDWAISRNSKLTDDQMQAMLNTEQGGMNETLANLYALTGKEKYLKLSLRFNHHRVVDPAAHQEDRLTGLHANTQIPKFIGTARQYELTGDDSLKAASLFFWNTVVKERSYVIGGHSDGEMFSPKEKLSQALGPNTTETCNTYNMLKLTRHLFCWEPKAEYADYYERALYNHILASQDPESGMMCYYVPLRSGSHRNYNLPNESFWCCTGTGVENHAKYADSIYFHGPDTLFVNLFIASELNWKAKGLKLRQDTTYPDEGRIKLTFNCEAPVDLTLNLRHPFWATKSFEISVNREKQPSTGDCGSYTSLKRKWKTGDTIEISMPFTLRTEAFKDNPNRFAILNGPLVLCAQIDPHRPFPAIVADQPTLLASLKPVPGKANTFTGPSDIFLSADDSPRAITLGPFNKASAISYETYWDRFTPAEWQTKKEEYKIEIARQKELDARTVDLVNAGEEQNERDHNLKEENTDTRDFNDRQFRIVSTNGWFAWDLKVLPSQPQELSVAFGRGGRGPASLDILIDGTHLATEHLGGSSQGRGPETKVYPLSPALLNGKEKITVKFQAPSDSRGGAISAARILKSAGETKSSQ